MKPALLFVDDEPQVRRGLSRMLWEFSDEWDCLFAEGAEEAIKILLEQHVDVLITDHNMPGMTGLELIVALRERPEFTSIPIIMLTGCNDRTLKRQALATGANDLLTKPVDQEDLLARIRSVLRLKAYQDELANKNHELEDLVRLRTIELEASRIEVVWRLAKIAESRDVETGFHTMRVGYYARAIAETLGQTEAFQETLMLAAPLHDIGKLAIPDLILQKPGALSPEERAIMETHCEAGYQILKAKYRPPAVHSLLAGAQQLVGISPFIEVAACVALQHHERWDGTGYPNRLSGEEIDLNARITAVADVYDALRSSRPYKAAKTEAETLAIMSEGAGSHFDPTVFRGFLQCMPLIRTIERDLADAEPDHSQAAA